MFEKWVLIVVLSVALAFMFLMGFMVWSDTNTKSQIGVACVTAGGSWDGTCTPKK